MIKSKSLRLVALASLFAGIAISCSKSSDISSPDSLLGFIPADTPYVFASLEPLPDDVMDKFEQQIDLVLPTYMSFLRSLISDKISQVSDEERAKSDAIFDEIEALLTIEGLRGAGIGRETATVLYGDGLLPVFRMRLTDAKLMEETIARIEEKAEAKMSIAEIDGQQYRYAGDEEAQLVIALIEDDMVITVLPSERSEDLLKSALGISRPENSIADSGELDKLIKDNDFKMFQILLVDVTRIVATFTDEQSGTNKELLALMDYDPASLSDVCKSEIGEMAKIMPRLYAGNTEVSTAGASGLFVAELRSDIAAGLTTITAPVPGLGTHMADLFSYGFSVDVGATKEFMSARFDAMEADPYECELLAEFQDEATQGRAMLDQPLPPMASGFRGFLANVDAIEGLDMATKQPPTSIDGSVLIAIDNPQALLAMGSMMLPGLAGLEIEADGVPVSMQLPPIVPGISEAYVAMTDDALAVAIGGDAESELKGLMSAGLAPSKPFTSMNMNAGRYYKFIGEVMKSGAANSDELSAETAEEMAKMMTALADWIGHVSVDINFTERGVEMPSRTEFVDD